MDANELTELIICFADKLRDYKFKESLLKEEKQDRKKYQYGRIISYFSGPLDEGFENVEKQIIDNDLRKTLDFLIDAEELSYFYVDSKNRLLDSVTHSAIPSIEEFMRILGEAKEDYNF